MKDLKPILSKTEDKVIRLYLLGQSREQIARSTFRSKGTIQRHFQNVYEKTATHNERMLMHWFFENVLNVNLRNLLAS